MALQLLLQALLAASCAGTAAAQVMALGVSLSPVAGYAGPLTGGGVAFGGLGSNFTEATGFYAVFWHFETKGADATQPICSLDAAGAGCTIQLLNGSSCEEPGSALWQTEATTNPWEALKYSFSRNYSGVGLATGLLWEQLIDKPVVVYDDKGAAALCGTKLGAFLAATWLPFANYTGPLRLQGGVELAYQGPASVAVRSMGLSSGALPTVEAASATTSWMGWRLNGTDPACGSAASAGGACGISVQGWEDGSIGGYLYNTSQANPWTAVSYSFSSQRPTKSVAFTTVPAGLTLNQLAHGAVVVRDAAGAPVAFSSFYLPSV